MKKRSFLLFALAAALVSGALAATPNAADVPATIPLGVTIGAVPVGGLTPQDAAAAVQQTFDRPLRLQLGATRISVTPDVLGATAAVDRAVQRALVASENTAVPLGVNAPGSSITPFVTKLAERYDRPAVDSSLVLRQMRPWLSKERPGSKLERRRAVQNIITALYSGVRGTIRLKQLPVRPKITRRNFGSVIVIRRSSNHLYLYRGMRFWRLFAVATGQAQYPTPLGRFCP